MVSLILLIVVSIALCHGAHVEWTVSESGYWFFEANWNPPTAPSTSSSVFLASQSSHIVVTIDARATITNLTIENDITLLFTNNASLTVLHLLRMRGGTLQNDITSLISNTSTFHLVLDGLQFTLSSHVLIVTFNISWLNGVFEMDRSSQLMLRDSQYSFDSVPELPGSTRVHVWGMNNGGKLGTGGTGDIESPRPVDLPSPCP
ncbi:hypothetical protein GEMRC1_008443 [Eukaryota sp. GEM-RC1]